MQLHCLIIKVVAKQQCHINSFGWMKCSCKSHLYAITIKTWCHLFFSATKILCNLFKMTNTNCSHMSHYI